MKALVGLTSSDLAVWRLYIFSLTLITHTARLNAHVLLSPVSAANSGECGVQRLLGGGVVIGVPSRFGNGYRGDASGDVADRPNVSTVPNGNPRTIVSSFFLSPVSLRFRYRYGSTFSQSVFREARAVMSSLLHALHQRLHFIDTIPIHHRGHLGPIKK